MPGTEERRVTGGSLFEGICVYTESGQNVLILIFQVVPL